MPLAADRCICLRKIEYSETSQILTLLGRSHGIVRVIAKGAHRVTKAGASKFGGGIDLLDIAQAVFSYAPHRDLPPLTEWRLLEGHRELRRHLRAIYLGEYAAELLGTLLQEHDAHPELFDRFEHTLRELATPRMEQAFLMFQLDLLREAGLLAELARCANCGADAASRQRCFFSAAMGGVVCRNCEQLDPARLEIDSRLLRLVQSLMNLPRVNGHPARVPMLTRHQTDPLNRIFAEHVRYSAGHALRLESYVLDAPV